ncbi:MAG: hypothetical protein LBE48_06365, partial [Methanomassiliicoccaceae archaeon]|nr:hypothetical protein [Methanomassiliicoccaceae archaeon]
MSEALKLLIQAGGSIGFYSAAFYVSEDSLLFAVALAFIGSMILYAEIKSKTKGKRTKKNKQDDTTRKKISLLAFVVMATVISLSRIFAAVKEFVNWINDCINIFI